MGFTLYSGLTDMSDRSVKCFSKCVQRPLAFQYTRLFDKNSNSQGPLV